ncbi:response regulator transcription factor [Listeria monocytogenes]|nr:response regulator transcription factor [Listeria monocytogenes]EGE9351424.1 response regulator transcription factor [Listeria monocytogenes]
MKIIIVEDEKKIRQELQLLLQSAGYEVIDIENFHDVVGQIIELNPDLILLDVHLPEEDGHELCRKIHKKMVTPIIFLTSDDSVNSEINGMLLGADDYISKPYHPSLLMARIATVLKRTKSSKDLSDNVLEHKGVSLDIRSYFVTYKNKCMDLSKNECKLLGYFFNHIGEVIPRLELIDYLWDSGLYIDDNALSVTVNRIRSKLEEIGVTDFIETKRGAGYRI